MNEGKDKTVLRRALLWIFVYIVLVNIGDEIGRQTGMGSLITALILVGFSGVLLKTHHLQDLLLRLPERNIYASVWFFIPLLILALIQWFVGLEATLGLSDILVAALLMMAVGFIEEVLFRGLLFLAIEKNSTTKRAIIISGITFGFGHIVNLLRGYSSTELLSQIAVAIAVGILLALLVAKTRSIIPGVIFHALFNFSGTVTSQDAELQAMLLVPILVVSVLYSIIISRKTSKGVVVAG
ncbi:MAG: CPBP family intramembrane metalloprotease [Sphaerochaeta sp.]|nr:CPBP family intramembrane metalloprotease [Sphaerochaeta sp.]